MGGRGGGGDGGRVQGGKGSAAKGNGSRCNAHYQQSTVGAANESPSFPYPSLNIPLSPFSLAKPGLFDQFEPIRGLQTGRRRNGHFAALAALV